MPARASWSGFLHVHQLRIPVKAFTAVSSQPEVTLNQLHAGCGQKIRQVKQCPSHGELKSEDVVSGYEFAKGRYVPIPAEELKALEPQDGKAIQVERFIGEREIDAVYHSGRTYYVVPSEPPAQRPFCLLRDGMRETARLAVSQVVMNHREHLVLLRPYGKLLAMTVLQYPQRVRAARDYEGEVADVSPGASERELIGRLIEALTDREFEISRYRDRYTDRLTEVIERRVAECSATVPSPETTTKEMPKSYDDATLLAALKASLKTAGVDDLIAGNSDAVEGAA